MPDYIKGVQSGRAWHLERKKNTRRNKRERWETGKRRERGKVVVQAHSRRTKAGKLIRVKGYLRRLKK